jgi:TPR repeat protein
MRERGDWMGQVEGSRIGLRFAAIILAALALGSPARAGSSEAFALYARGDYVAAAELLRPLAEAGNPRAQGMLGFLYEYGHGVPQNFGLAAMWYSCGADGGDPTAQYLLGLLYDKGRGVPEDVVLAQKWLILAAMRTNRRDRDLYIRVRDAVASKMTIGQVTLAQQLATQWVSVMRLPAY